MSKQTNKWAVAIEGGPTKYFPSRDAARAHAKDVGGKVVQADKAPAPPYQPKGKVADRMSRDAIGAASAAFVAAKGKELAKVATIHYVCDHTPGINRTVLMHVGLAAGFNRNTLSWQWNAWRTKNGK
jgi:hypothetical protein